MISGLLALYLAAFRLEHYFVMLLIAVPIETLILSPDQGLEPYTAGSRSKRRCNPPSFGPFLSVETSNMLAKQQACRLPMVDKDETTKLHVSQAAVTQQEPAHLSVGKSMLAK